MTTYTGTITNGSATIEIDTTGMNEGAYDVSTQYAQNNKYTSATKTSLLTLQQSSTWTYADITTSSTQWTKTPSSDGIHSTLNAYVTWKQQLPDNITIQIRGNLNSTQGGIEFRDAISGNSSSLSWNCHNGLNKWGSIGSGRIANYTWNTGDFLLEISKNNGVFTWKFNDDTSTTVDINSNKLNTPYLAFYVNNGEIVLSEIRYKLNE